MVRILLHGAFRWTSENENRAEAICTNLPASILTPSPSATAVEKNLYTCVLMVICVPPGGGKGCKFFVYMFRCCLF